MKDNELHELKPVYIREDSYSAAGEIKLVDLAAVLVRRKKMIAIIITLIIAAGTIKTLLTPNTYNFSSSIEIGSQVIDGTFEVFESPQTLLAKLQYSFIPQALREHQLTNPKDKIKYNIEARIPKASTIVVLETKGTEAQSDVLIKLLQEVTKKAIHDHNRIYTAVKHHLTSSIKQTQDQLASLDTKTDQQSEKIALLNGNIETYKSQLANLRNTQEVLPPMKSIKPTGASKKLIIIATAFAGIFLAIFSAFFAEFVVKVKEKSSTA